MSASDEMIDQQWMRRALELAARGAQSGEVPVGAMLVRDGAALAAGWNRPIGGCDPSAHAEIEVLRRAAAELGNYRLPGSTLYVTLEPCVMCVGALLHARVERLVYGAAEPKTGAVCSAFELLNSPRHNHRVVVTGGVLEAECRAQLQSFFARRRAERRAARAARSG